MGGKIGYTYSKEDKTKKNSFVIAPLARKYWSVGEKVSLFGQLIVPVEFGNTKTSTTSGTSKVDYTSWGININPGIDVFLTSHWSIEATWGKLGYDNYKEKGAKADDKFSLNVDLTDINFGLKYIF